MAPPGSFKSARLARGVLDDGLRESLTRTEEEIDSFLPESREGKLFPVPFPAHRASSSVPFKWEEAPGKPRASCRESSFSRTDLQLQLPPRLEFRHSFASDKPHSAGQKMRLRHLTRRHTGLGDSQNRVGQLKSYVRTITLQPRAIRCVFTTKDHEISVPSSGDGFSGPSNETDNLDSPRDSVETDTPKSTESRASSWCPDLSPDADSPGEAHKPRRKLAMERFAKFLSLWVAIRKLKWKQTKKNDTEMWSPTLATYLYNERREASSKSGMAKEQWHDEGENRQGFGSSKQSENEDGDDGYDPSYGVEAEMSGVGAQPSLHELLTQRDDNSSSCSSSPSRTPKEVRASERLSLCKRQSPSRTPKELRQNEGLSLCKRRMLTLTLPKTVRLLVKRLHSPRVSIPHVEKVHVHMYYS